MSLSRLVYVTCDDCGAPAGSTDDLADDAQGARSVAKRLGWTRVNGRDLCLACTHNI